MEAVIGIGVILVIFSFVFRGDFIKKLFCICGVLCIVLAVMAKFFFVPCPHCEKWVYRYVDHCPNCGQELEDIYSIGERMDDTRT